MGGTSDDRRRWVTGARILADGVACSLSLQMGDGSEDPRRWVAYGLSPQMATCDVELAPGCDGGAAPKPPERLGPRPQPRSLGDGDLVLSPTEPLRLKGRDDRAC